MREAAQIIGWIWVVFQGLAGIYGFVSETIGGGLEAGIVKGGLLVVTCLILALPGLALIWWGKRGSRQDQKVRESVEGDSSPDN